MPPYELDIRSSSREKSTALSRSRNGIMLAKTLRDSVNSTPSNPTFGETRTWRN